MVRSPRFRARPATAGLIAVCVALFVVCWIAAAVRAEQPLRALRRAVWTFEDPVLLEQLGALSAARVWLDAEWWRVAAAGLLHGSWLHLGLNMMGLWAVGQWTEQIWGWWRQLLLFCVASLGGCLASLAWAEAPLVVGASAGIFGVAGALVVARAWGPEATKQAIQPVSARSLGFWLVFWLVIGAVLPLFGVSLLAQAGHLGGLIFGVLAGCALSVAPERRLLRGMLWSGVAVGLVALVAAAREPSWRPNYHVFTGAELLRRGEFEAAAARFDDAMVAAPDDPVLANAVAYSLAEAAVDLDRAEALVRISLEDQPDNADYLDTLGWVFCQQGRAAEGRAALERAKAAAWVEAIESDWRAPARLRWVFEHAAPIPEIDQHLKDCDSVRPAGE